MRLLLLSNSTDPEGQYLVHARDELRTVLGGRQLVAFVPYAAVAFSYDAYAAKVAEALAPIGVRVESVHGVDDAAGLVRSADAIAVGGGNTFRLLERVTALGLLEVIRERVHQGASYVGWSAGSVLACPTISTTNDMPIVQPPSFDALGFVPFQINAHYTDFHPPRFRGETRAERLAEFLALNPERRVIGLREGAMLDVDGDRMVLRGTAGARVFAHGEEPRDYAAGADLSALLGQQKVGGTDDR